MKNCTLSQQRQFSTEPSKESAGHLCSGLLMPVGALGLYGKLRRLHQVTRRSYGTSVKEFQQKDWAGSEISGSFGDKSVLNAVTHQYTYCLNTCKYKSCNLFGALKVNRKQCLALLEFSFLVKSSILQARYRVAD